MWGNLIPNLSFQGDMATLIYRERMIFMKNWKRSAAGLIAMAMLVSACPVFPASAASTALGLTPAFKSDTTAPKFSHNEWTGKNGAEDVFAVNREAATLSIVPYQDTETAAKGVWDYNAREDSTYLQMLTGSNGGNWDLTVVQNADKAFWISLSYRMPTKHSR